MKRAALFVDGFNLYHAIDELNEDRLKWVCLKLLGERIVFKRTEQLVSVWYFTAFASHLQARRPDVVKRHRTYVAALEATGVNVQLGNFKRKSVVCSNCGARWERHEEKETDVNIAVSLISLGYQDQFDVAYVLTADTDLAPAFRTLREVVSPSIGKQKEVVSVFPPVRPGTMRHVAALQQASDRQIKLNAHHIRTCRLPDQLVDSKQRKINCPVKYQ